MKRKSRDPWAPLDQWIARASRHLAHGRLIPLGQFDLLAQCHFYGFEEAQEAGRWPFLRWVDPFFREEQKPLLKRSWQRWAQRRRKEKLG